LRWGLLHHELPPGKIVKSAVLDRYILTNLLLHSNSSTLADADLFHGMLSGFSSTSVWWSGIADSFTSQEFVATVKQRLILYLQPQRQTQYSHLFSLDEEYFVCVSFVSSLLESHSFRSAAAIRFGRLSLTVDIKK
jgi:hypothetical protein